MIFRDLPVYRHRDEIIDAVRKNRIVIIESPTGSGKTTQIPLILSQAGYDNNGIIGITQPRRIAALSVSEFIKKQIGDTKSYCGCKMRFFDTTDNDTRIKIMTDGILLQEVKHDKTLSKYSVIMVDEAHERSLNIDFILGLLKEISAERKDLKIIISSATINASSFSVFLNNAPIITIDSRPYDVSVSYDPIPLIKGNEFTYYSKIASLVTGIFNRNEGDILIFLPGEAEIKDCIAELGNHKISKKLDIYPLYGRLSKEEQEEVFTPTGPGRMKVVVSTNIAETSLTIDGIRTVIDSGMAKVNYYNQKTFTSALLPMPISKSSADQRKGRAGRTAPGKCIRLYSEESYDKRPEYTEEEILHSDLAEVVLRMSELEIYNTNTFPFITPPLRGALKSAEETLISMRAIERNHRLTKIGEMMTEFPLLPRLSRIIVESILNYPDVISDVLGAVSFLSAKTPFVLPPEDELSARDRHKALSDPVYGDFISMLKIQKSYSSLGTQKEKESYCAGNYLDKETLDEISHIRTQIEMIVSSLGIPIIDKHRIPEYFCCLASGLRQYICVKCDKYSYRSTTEKRIMIHPGSAWFKRLPEYILAGEIVKTSRMYARTVSPLRAEWIEAVDPSILNALRESSGKHGKVSEDFSKTKETDFYSASINGRKECVVPLSELRNISVRDSTRIYIKCGDTVSKKSIKAKKLDGEITLVPNVSTPCKKRLTRNISPAKKQFGDIESMLSILFMPYSPPGKKTFVYLSLSEDSGRYSIVPNASIETAARETLYSLGLLIDEIPTANGNLRSRINSIIDRISKSMGMD